MEVFQSTPVWQLAASVTPTEYGNYLLISSFIPTARRPEHHVKFAATLSFAELRKLRDTINHALNLDPVVTQVAAKS